MHTRKFIEMLSSLVDGLPFCCCCCFFFERLDLIFRTSFQHYLIFKYLFVYSGGCITKLEHVNNSQDGKWRLSFKVSFFTSLKFFHLQVFFEGVPIFWRQFVWESILIKTFIFLSGWFAVLVPDCLISLDIDMTPSTSL